MSDPNASLMRRALGKIEELQAQLNTLEAAAAEPVALVGYGCRMPGGIDSPEALWRLLSEGRDAIGDIPAGRWDIDSVYDPEPGIAGKMYSKRGGFIRDVDQFDPAFFGISPREAARLDPQQRLLLEVSWEALERAGIAPLSLRESKTGVYIGQATNDYAQLHVKAGDPTVYDTYFATGTATSVASGRLSYTLGLQGPAVTLDTACSSSLVALHLASQALRKGECDLALVGGVNLILSPEAVIAMCQSRMMAPDGVCKTFDASADGFGQAEGCIVIVVKRLSDAVRDGDPVLALIRGSAINQDGSSSGLTAPNGPSQTAVVRAAFADARLSPADCSYVEAHGTGTSLGDPIEIQALDAAFGANRSPDKPLWTGSIKTNLGHLEAAAGLAGLLKVALSLQHREIPAHLHFQNPNPLIPWDDIKVRVADRSMPFPQINGRRVAGLSSFGFSGTNAHVVLEEAPGPMEKPPILDRAVELVTLSAKGTAAQRDLATAFRALLEAQPTASLSDLASSANIGRSPTTHRIALTAASTIEAKQQLDAFLAGFPAEGLQSGAIESSDPPRIAFLFTGQGAQYPDMGRALYEKEPVFRAAFDDCDSRFRPFLPASIADTVYGASDGTALNQTQWTQPALFAVEWALAQLWRSWGVEPGLVIGHSIGEYVAACLAGVFSLDDAVRLVAARATLMGCLPEGGAMTAVMADEPDLLPILESVDGLSLAAVNGPKSAVLSGPMLAIEKAEQRMAAADISFTRLSVSHAFHSAMLEPILDEFEAVASEIAMSDPVITLISNLTGEPARRGSVTTGRYWRDQTRGTVRFADGIKTAQKLGYRVFVEVGPRPILTHLAQRTLGDESLCVATLESGRDAWRAALDALGRLYLKGAPIDWKSVHGTDRSRIMLPTYPFQRSRHWLEAQAPTVARPMAVYGGQGHPHLTHRTNSALGETIFEIRLDPARHPYLADHIVHGAVIVPTAFYLDVIASAVAEVRGSASATLEDIVIHQPVNIPAQGHNLQLILNPRSAPDRFELYSRSSEGWDLAVSGSCADTAPPASRDLGELSDADDLETLTIDRFYVALDRIGLGFGPSFHRLSALARRDGTAKGDVSALPHAGFGIHPAMLDGCLQTLAAALPGFDLALVETDVYMPIAIDRFELFQPASGPLSAFAHYEPGSSTSGTNPPEIRVGHLSIRDTNGQPIGRVTGIRMKRADAMSGRVHAADELLYRVEWSVTGNENGITDRSVLADCNGLSFSAELEADFARLSRLHKLDGLTELDPILDTLCAAYVLRALKDLGWCGSPGTVLVLDELLGQIAPQHHRLARRLLAMLAEDNVLAEQAGGNWLVLGDMTGEIVIDIPSLVDRFPQFRAEILFAERGGSQLEPALRGHVDAAEVLFPGGSFELADELYRRSPAALVFNALAARTVAEALRLAPEGRPIRILEIGGGTGGVTSAILPILPADRVSYLFTDISPAFLQKARSDFAAYPFLDFECLDIERTPADQGFAQNNFDLVVASNVLHATDNLAVTIEHARSLLAPGGQLLVLEGLRAVRWIDLSFGLTEGWWKFSDTSLRSDYPLMPASSWRSMLADKGFGEPLITPDATGSSWVGQGLILARLDRANRLETAGRPLIFVDRAGAADRLVTQLRSRGSSPSLVRAGDLLSETDEGFVIDPHVHDHYVHILSALSAKDALPDTVIFLWPIDAEIAPDAPLDELTRLLDRCCGSLLRLLQAYAATARGAPLKLWIITQRAQAVLATDRVQGMVQSAILGLAKVAALEFPEIACHRLDLDQPQDVDALEHELDQPEEEPIIAIRHGQRYAARLERASLPEPSLAEGRSLHIVDQGSFEGLALQTVPRPTLGDRDVEIRVAASGLNFRDVLNVLGARDDDAPFGGEVSGVITRMGAGVQGLRVGQSVVSVTYGGHGDFAAAPAALTLPKPDNLDWSQAAGSALAFLTAHYALTVIGEAKRGERVLVHAAAGGVGMAAVLMARRAGLEVFATAGSETKRRILSSMGIANVYDSRTLDFADAIRGDTNGEGIDIVLSAVTGPAIAAGLKLLRKGGRYLEIGKAEILTDDEVRTLNGEAAYRALDLAELIVRAPDTVRPWFVEILDKLACADVQPIPTQSFPLADAGAAFEHMARARHVGKVVLDINNQPAASGHAAGEPLLIEPDATYLISGGLTGLGLASAQRLVDRGARHLLLFGRRAPSSEARHAIDLMRDFGAQVVVASVDAGNETAMRALFEGPLSAMPPLRGVIHSAGRLEDATLPQQNWDRFLDVLGPKAHGAWLLHQLCAGKPLDFFVLYSSASAILGAPGQSNHASANAFLDALAAYRRGQGMPGLSINWGAWSDIGAAAGQHTLQRLGGQGVAAITVAEGLSAFERLLEQPEPQIAVMRADWNRVGDSVGNALERRFLAKLITRSFPSATGTGDVVAHDIASAPANKRRDLLTGLVKEQVAQVLGVAGTATVSEIQPFRDMGLDSLMALELRTRLKKSLALETPLPATMAFDHPTVAALISYLMSEVLGFEAVEPPAAKTVQDRAVIDEIEQMSDDEIDRMLNQRRAGVS